MSCARRSIPSSALRSLLALADLAVQQQNNVQQILKGGYHLLELINEVLDLARIEAGRLSMSPEPVQIKDAVKEALDLVRPIASLQNITLSADFSAHGDRYVQADRQRLKQVLLNLLSNAIKFNRSNGLVVLRCEETGDSGLRIEVADTGLGIDEEGLKKIFTPFERLGADRNAVGGTGLGLALSKRMVEAMGGTIGVESTVGVGSRFYIRAAAGGACRRAQSGSRFQRRQLTALAPGRFLSGNHPVHRGQSLEYPADRANPGALSGRALASKPCKANWASISPTRTRPTGFCWICICRTCRAKRYWRHSAAGTAHPKDSGHRSQRGCNARPDQPPQVGGRSRVPDQAFGREAADRRCWKRLWRWNDRKLPEPRGPAEPEPARKLRWAPEAAINLLGAPNGSAVTTAAARSGMERKTVWMNSSPPLRSEDPRSAGAP